MLPSDQNITEPSASMSSSTNSSRRGLPKALGAGLPPRQVSTQKMQEEGPPSSQLGSRTASPTRQLPLPDIPEKEGLSSQLGHTARVSNWEEAECSSWADGRTARKEAECSSRAVTRTASPTRQVPLSTQNITQNTLPCYQIDSLNASTATYSSNGSLFDKAWTTNFIVPMFERVQQENKLELAAATEKNGANLKSEFTNQDAALKKSLLDLKTELKSDLKSEFTNQDAALTNSLLGLKTDLKSEVDNQNAALTNSLLGLKTDLKSEVISQVNILNNSFKRVEMMLLPEKQPVASYRGYIVGGLCGATVTLIVGLAVLKFIPRKKLFHATISPTIKNTLPDVDKGVTIDLYTQGGDPSPNGPPVLKGKAFFDPNTLYVVFQDPRVLTGLFLTILLGICIGYVITHYINKKNITEKKTEEDSPQKKNNFGDVELGNGKGVGVDTENLSPEQENLSPEQENLSPDQENLPKDRAVIKKRAFHRFTDWVQNIDQNDVKK